MGYQGGTIEQVLGKLRDCLLRPDQIGMLNTNFRLTASNIYIQSLLPPGTRLTRDVLDRLSASPAEDEFGTGTTRPIVVRDSGGHEFSTNSQAIINAGIDANTPDPPGGFIGRDANGVPNGLFADFSAAWGPNPPAPPDSTYLSRIQNVAEATRKGITSYLRPGGSESDLAHLEAHRRRRQADRPHQPGARRPAPCAARTTRRRSRSFIDGHQRRPAGLRRLREPDQPGRDPRRHRQDLLRRRRRVPVPDGGDAQAVQRERRHTRGPGLGAGHEPRRGAVVRGRRRPASWRSTASRWSIHIHSLGNRSARVALDNFAASRRYNRKWDSRHTITHLEFVHPDDMRRFGKLDVVANMTMNWAGRDAYTVDSVEGYLDPSVMRTIYAARSLQRGGAVLAGGSDWPVTPLRALAPDRDGGHARVRPGRARRRVRGQAEPARGAVDRSTP